MPSIQCASMRCSPDASTGFSFPFASEKRRETASAFVSISTSSSSIMQPEYCRVPSGEMRLPCGIVQVTTRVTSVIVGTYTTEMDDGTMSPCRLKLAENMYRPSGVTSSEAGKLPSRIPGAISVSGPRT